MTALVDLIIPTIKGREESLERCVDSYVNTGEDVNPIIISDSLTCGWGWREGIAKSTAPFLLLACDDQESIVGGWDRVAIETVVAGQLPCPRVWTPAGTIESNGGDMNANGHVIGRPQRDGKPVDYTTVPFVSREQIDRIGMLDVHYASDVWISYRGRQLGYETVLRHGFEVRHYQEQVGRGAGMSQNDRDAHDCEIVFEKLKEVEAL